MKTVVVRLDEDKYRALVEFLSQFKNISFYPGSFSDKVRDLLSTAEEVPDLDSTDLPRIIHDGYEDWHQMGHN